MRQLQTVKNKKFRFYCVFKYPDNRVMIHHDSYVFMINILFNIFCK